MAQDTSFTREYQIRMARDPSTDSSLAGLNVSHGALDQPFNPSNLGPNPTPNPNSNATPKPDPPF